MMVGLAASMTRAMIAKPQWAGEATPEVCEVKVAQCMLMALALGVIKKKTEPHFSVNPTQNLLSQ